MIRRLILINVGDDLKGDNYQEGQEHGNGDVKESDDDQEGGVGTQ